MSGKGIRQRPLRDHNLIPLPNIPLPSHIGEGAGVREAQLALLRSKEFSNPWFWAAFTLTGQWN